MRKGGCAHLLADRNQGARQTGVTSNVPKRIWQHRNETSGGFTAEYGIKRSMRFESVDSIEAAIAGTGDQEVAASAVMVLRFDPVP